MRLSKIKKNIRTDPHLWVIFRAGRRYMVSIGDPTSPRSRIVRSFPNKNELQYWIKYDMTDEVSRDHILDRSGHKIISDYYTQWYADNMRDKDFKGLEKRRPTAKQLQKLRAIHADAGEAGNWAYARDLSLSKQMRDALEHNGWIEVDYLQAQWGEKEHGKVLVTLTDEGEELVK